MKSKRGKRGPKKRGAWKQIEADKSFDENFNLAAMGEFGNPKLLEIFQMVALAGKYPTFAKAKLVEVLRRSLARIPPPLIKMLFPSLKQLNVEPWRSIADAIEVAKRINESSLQLMKMLLLLQETIGVTETVSAISPDGSYCAKPSMWPVCLLVTRSQFAEQYHNQFGESLNPDYAASELPRIGVFFRPGKRGRPHK
jgi:hypothetical protein